MSLKTLPDVRALERPAGYSWDAPADALACWSARPSAAEADDPNTISIYGVIGEDFWTGEGFTEARAAAALRSIGPNAITVNINSPGGDMFDGVAIYNMFREHPAKVTVKIFGVAASAASAIAMAGDEVLMGTGSMMMIHNAWGIVIGNRHDFADAASVFGTFDQSLAAIYAARTGLDEAEILTMLDGPNRQSDGTWLTAAEAIEKGFADAGFESPPTDGQAQAGLPEGLRARRRIEAALAKQGMGRRERSDLIQSLSGQRDATGAARDAGDLTVDDLVSAIATLKR